MRLPKRLCGLAVALIVLPASLAAQPVAGLGLFAGFTQYDNETSLLGLGLTYESDGTSFGLDFQIPLGDAISVNPFYMTSSEDADVFDELFIASADVTNEILGVQLRLWAGEQVFFGVHAAQYTQTVDFELFVDEDGSGTGFGLAAGFETGAGSNIALFGTAQYDSAEMDVLDGFADTELTGYRVHVGVRIPVGG